MFPLRVGAQISPGDLSQSHAHLEGMSNCTKCHDLGKKVSINKCLDCHQEIKNLITAKRGYHGNSSHINKECIECHSEHNGRKFEMTRFDKENFDHDLTGYKLEGKHKVVDCGECHLPDNIADPEIKKRKNTFLGLNKECLSCHEDFHQKTLSKECLSCHNMEAFRPASKFDHDNSRFKLLGSHTRVDCKECHKISNRNGKSFQEFSGISFNDCNSCHNDPHNQRIKGKCSQCHNEVLFSNFIGKGRFNHNSTNFSLKGRHVDIDCYSCHSKTKNPKLVFKDRQGINENNCLKCHEDRHDGKFGKDCSQCHNEKSFISVKNMDSFDHSLTDYPLSGKHTEVDCKKCHPGRFSKAISFDACTDCHSDYHNGEFRKN